MARHVDTGICEEILCPGTETRNSAMVCEEIACPGNTDC